MYFLCDLYFPITEVSPDIYDTYHETNIFGPHQMPSYPDNPSVASVNSAGRIVARGEGTATIKVISTNGKVATCTVQVS